MGFFARLRFLIGIVFVIILVGALFLYLSYSMSNISSRTATLQTDAYSVITEYSGTLKEQYVTAGDEVKEGDQLFEIESSDLTRALGNDSVEEESLGFEVTDDGNMMILASAPGTVRQTNFATGAFVEVDSTLASITTENTQYVTARYLLNAPDYARINRENPVRVTLPDNTKLEADVFDITLEQDGEQVFTVVKARFDEGTTIPSPFSSGTPVSASWQLDNSDWQETIFRSIRSLIEPTTEV